jgi:hypothetical protein
MDQYCPQSIWPLFGIASTDLARVLSPERAVLESPAVVEPGGQRVNASNYFYLGEGAAHLLIWGAWTL